MKAHHILLLLLHVAIMLPMAAQIPVSATQDTIPNTENWSPREPLSPEEQQRRADKAAELEAMRQRFRRYHRNNAQEEAEQAAEAAESDYLWSDAEVPVQATPSAVKPTQTTESQQSDSEDLRLEIGRSLQVKGEVTTPSERPAIYDAPQPVQATDAWEGEWQRLDNSSEPTSATPTNTDWATKLGQATTETSPVSKTYRAGAILALVVGFTADGLSLAPNPQPALEEWVQRLYAQPTLAIEVRTHAHVNRSHAEADTWSAQRAQAVKDYFLTQGVAGDRIQIRGYGKRAPLTFDLSAEGQRLNERVEVIVLSE